MKNDRVVYTPEEIKSKMREYVNTSVKRLRSRLQVVWKGQKRASVSSSRKAVGKYV